MSRRKRTPLVWAFTAALVTAWTTFIVVLVTHN